MAWEIIPREPGGRSFGVTVSWRTLGGRKNPAMAVSLGRETCRALGLVKQSKGEHAQRVCVQRDRMAGKLRVFLATDEPVEHQRAVAWKDKGCTITVPLDDVKLAEDKPAQDVRWSIEDGGAALVVKLPHWACPLIQISGGAAR